MIHLASLETASVHPMSEQPPEPSLFTISPGIACLELNSGSDFRTALYLKQQLEAQAPQGQAAPTTNFDYELTLHRLHPAGWKMENGSTPDDRLIALFTRMDRADDRLESLQSLRQSETYKSRVISDWSEIYHHRFFRNNPNMVQWDKFIPVSEAFAHSFVATLTNSRPEVTAQTAKRRAGFVIPRIFARAATALVTGFLSDGSVAAGQTHPV
jgi:hypothetical protein